VGPLRGHVHPLNTGWLRRTGQGHARVAAVNGMKKRGSIRRIAALGVGVASLALVAGCSNGFDAMTSTQRPSGDGLSTQVGSIQIRSAIWVRSSTEPANMTLSVTFVNTGMNDDTLTGVSTDPKAFAVGITGNELLLKPFVETRAGFNSDLFINAYGLNVAPSGWTETTFRFRDAGTVKGSVLTVPSEGSFAGIEPVPATIEGEVKKDLKPSATASPTASVAQVPAEPAEPRVP
jgi:hypothetical protein